MTEDPKSVAFSTTDATAAPEPVSVVQEEEDNENYVASSSDEDEDQEEVLPTRNLTRSTKTMRRSMYFDLQTGTRIEAPTTTNGNDEYANFLFRTQGKSIQLIDFGDIVSPAPRWKRFLRRLGLMRESSSSSSSSTPSRSNVAAPDSTHSNPEEGNYHHNNDDIVTATLRHFRIERDGTSFADKTSLFIDNMKAASSVSEYLRWTFRASFTQVLFQICIQFIVLAVLFAICLLGVDYQQPQCISGGARREDDGRIYFGDAVSVVFLNTYYQ
jgi:hypothetical protein